MKQNIKDNLASAYIGASLPAGLFLTLGPSLMAATYFGPKPENFKPVAVLVGALATVAAIGLGVFFIKGNKSSTAQNSTPAKAPVENTLGISFLNHENAFNTPARNSKKTLALTAKDFSSAPIVAQRSLAA